MRTYGEVVEAISSARRFGSLPGVEVAGRALACLGGPMEGIPFIHVAGTNGKGSVCAFLTEILRNAGIVTGTFTSPHLIRFEERIAVDGTYIARDDVVRLGNFLLDQDFGVAPTMFDYCLLMAALYFRERGCGAAVIETGLGGRLDSTNALGTPEVAVLTRIGMDHTSILGDSLVQIAGEKAGIIKPGSYVVAEAQETPEVEAVFIGAAASCGARLVSVSGEDRLRLKDIPMRMEGVFQRENAAAAWLAAREFLLSSTDLTADRIEECCREGVASAVWPGRMQVLSRDPFLLVDGAHNPQGVAALAQSLEALFPGERFHFLMGVMADKDYVSMLDALEGLALSFVAVTVEGERALQAGQLAQEIRARGIRAGCATSVRDALDHLPQGVRSVAFGSLYFIGEVLEAWDPDDTGSSPK